LADKKNRVDRGGGGKRGKSPGRQYGGQKRPDYRYDTSTYFIISPVEQKGVPEAARRKKKKSDTSRKS